MKIKNETPVVTIRKAPTKVLNPVKIERAINFKTKVLKRDVGKWILTHWLDTDPVWMILTYWRKDSRGFLDLIAFDPVRGVGFDIGSDQIEKIGDKAIPPRSM